MNTMWSSRVQGIGTLDSSRELRFHDALRTRYQSLFKLDDAHNILEVGCGTGALCRALARWYPNAQVTGLDRDDVFISYARRRGGAHYVEGDALKLPFEDNSFDAVISYTVLEHVEPAAFLAEQMRVLRPGGVCLVLSARRGIDVSASCMQTESEAEKAIWARIENKMRDNLTDCGVARYAMNESEIPAWLEKCGFSQVETDYMAVNLTPDHPCNDPQTALQMIEAERIGALESIDHAAHLAGELMSAAEADTLRQCVNARYDRRRALYEAGEKQWDVKVALTMAVRGVKAE